MDNTMTTRAQRRTESDSRILRAAAKIFGSLGYSRATLTDIALEAGVSQGLVSQRFSSKANLLEETFRQTQVLSFYSEEDRHLPQVFNILLDHLKREVAEEPEWFSFLSMIHTGTDDVPQSFTDLTYEMFSSTPLLSAIVEAQEQNDLPAGNPWDLFRVFFRNAINLIGWHHEFGLPMPGNESFLYAIQYNRRQKEADAAIIRQKKEIQCLENERDMLFSAVSDLYPLIICSNLTQNTYFMLEYDHFTTKRASDQGVYDDLIRVGASTVPDETQRRQFLRLFERENVIRAYESGKRQLCLRHLQTGDDGIVRWIETRVLFKGCACGSLRTITLSRQIGDEMERLQRYGEALQNAELAEGAKSRFLSNLSHEIRTPMNNISGCTELLQRHADKPDKVRGYAEKMRTAEEELMELLSQALDAANLSPVGAVHEIKLNINECCSVILANAGKIAEARGIELRGTIGALRDDYVYTDEIRLNRSVMRLIVGAINESVPGDYVQITLEQLDDAQENTPCFRLTIRRIGSETDGAPERKSDDAPQEAVASPKLEQIREDIRALGSTLEIRTEGQRKVAECVFRFRRTKN